MGQQFFLENWAAVAAGLATRPQWLEWFRSPAPLPPLFTPELPGVDPGLRRRLAPLGRAVLGVVGAVRPPEPCPIVFVSRYGDLSLTAQLLDQLAREGVVSPMGFSLSVHNAVAGICSIATGDRTATTSLAANHELAESGVIEALGWLACGASRVIVVCAEDPIPPPFAADGADAGAFRYAWAGLFGPASAGGCSIEVRADAPHGDTVHEEQEMPGSLRVLAFLAGAAPGNELDIGRYRWQRHAA